MIIVNKPDDRLIDAQCYKCKTIFKIHPMQNMNTDYVNDCALHRKSCDHKREDERMIDYQKLKLVHELADKIGSQINYAYENKDGNYVAWVSLDQLLLEMQELTKPEKPKTKYKVGEKVWRLCDEYLPRRLIIKDIDCASEKMYMDENDNWWLEEQLYPSKEDLIKSQIAHWSILYEELNPGCFVVCTNTNDLQMEMENNG